MFTQTITWTYVCPWSLYVFIQLHDLCVLLKSVKLWESQGKHPTHRDPVSWLMSHLFPLWQINSVISQRTVLHHQTLHTCSILAPRAHLRPQAVSFTIYAAVFAVRGSFMALPIIPQCFIYKHINKPSWASFPSAILELMSFFPLFLF